ncbi:hypothetical protein ACQPYK_37730 [Streptosporangium sp. CA-135522]
MRTNRPTGDQLIGSHRMRIKGAAAKAVGPFHDVVTGTAVADV